MYQYTKERGYHLLEKPEEAKKPKRTKKKEPHLIYPSIIPKGVAGSGMIQLTQRRVAKEGTEEQIFFLAVSDISSLMLRTTDSDGRPLKCTRVGLKSGGYFHVKETPLVVRGLMSKAL